MFCTVSCRYLNIHIITDFDVLCVKSHFSIIINCDDTSHCTCHTSSGCLVSPKPVAVGDME